MNKIFKVIWSKTRNCYIVVSEIAKRSGKCSSSLNKKIIAAFLAAGTVLSVTGSAWAAQEPLSDDEIISLRNLLKNAAVKTSGTVTQATATGDNSVAIGNGAKAEDTGNIAIGNGATAKWIGDPVYDPSNFGTLVAIGSGATASGSSAVAIGYNTTASGLNAIAMGYGSQATNANTVAMGQEAKATGYQSFAIGTWSEAKGSGSTTIGYQSKAGSASSANATAIGGFAEALGWGSVAIGAGNTNDVDTTQYQAAQASGELAVSIGNWSKATGYGGVATGYQSRATGSYSSAYGYNSYVAGYVPGGMGDYGSAFGGYSQAGDYGSAFGGYSQATGYYGAASGFYARAAGTSSTAIGSYSHAEGTNAIATGYLSHAIGANSSAFGASALANDINTSAFGLTSTAYGEGSVALGHSTTTGVLTKTVQGSDGTYIAGTYTQDELDGTTVTKHYVFRMKKDGSGVVAYDTIGKNYYEATDDGSGTYTIGAATTVDESSLVMGGIAIGSYAHVEGDRAMSIGRASGAYGKDSTAIGHYANALGEGSMAIGHGTVTGAEGITISRIDEADPDSHTITLKTDANGNPVSNKTYGGIAIGSYSHATGERSMAIGRVSGAYNENSTAMGLYSNAFGEGAMAIGHNATAGAEVTIAADPSNPDHHTAVMTLYDADGNVSTSGTGKRSTTPNGTYTQGGIAFGSYAHAVGDRAIAFGRVSGAYGTNSTAMGIYANALGQGAIAMGHGSSAGVTVTVNPTGDEGTAERADGFWTTTLNTDTTTGNPISNGNDGGIAIGSYAHTEGTRAMAIGRVAGAYGTNSTVVGLRSNAYGEGSMAFGHGVTAGKDDRDDPLHTRYAKQVVELHNNPELEYDLDGTEGAIYTDSDGNPVAIDPNNVIGAVAMGSYAEATGRGSLSVGRYSKAKSAYSTTLGIRASVLESAENAIAIGREATVDALTEGRTYGGLNSIAIGTLTSVKGQNSIAIGSADMLSDDGTEIVATDDRKPTSVTGDKSIAIGMNDTVEGTSSIAIGTGHTVKGDGSGAIGDPSIINGDNSYAVGNNNNIAVNDGLILGNNASVTEEGGVALGTNAIASTDKGVAGYDPTTGEASTATDDPTWTATAAAVSVGGGTPTDTKVTVTRQISNVAAGYEDTDAVNVAQLKLAMDGKTDTITKITSKDESVAITGGDVKDGVITFDLSVKGAGTDTTYKMSSKQTDDKGEGTKATVTLTGSDGTSQSVDIVDTNTHTSVIGDGKYITVEQTGEASAKAGPEYTVSLNTSELKKVINTDTSNTVKAGDRITVKENPNAEDRTEYTISGADIKAGDNIEVTYDDKANEFTVATAADVKFENVEVNNEFKAGDTVINKDGVTTNEFKAGDTVINEGGVTTNNIETKNINVTENITYKGDTIVTDVTYEGDSNTLTVTKGDEVNEYVLKGNVYEGDKKTINISEDNVISVIEGNVAEGDKGLVTGDTVYNETRVKNDGNYVKKDNTAADNITALDEKVYENSQNIENLGNAINNTSNQINNLDNRMRKGLAGAAALAALHPMDFNPDDKLQFSAGVGNYRGETAAAVGAFYRPDESVMFSIGGTFGNGDNMVNAGITFGLDGNKNRITRSRTAMAHEIVELRGHIAKQDEQIARLTDLVNKLVAPEQRLDNPSMFPDVPENHWAYAYLEDLQKRGIVEGYPDGQFKGDRAMTRYEFAAMMDRALQKGEKLDARIAEEFESELGRIYIERIKGQDNDRKKVERVRVNNSDSKYPEGKTRDVYGGKIVTEVPEKVAAAK